MTNVVLAVPSGGGLSTGEREDRKNRWVLGAFSVIAFAYGLLFVVYRSSSVLDT